MKVDALLEQVRDRIGGAAAAELADAPDVRNLIDKGHAGDAFDAARRICAARNGDPAFAYWIGVAAAFAGRPAQAEPWLVLAIEANEKDFRAHAALAYISKPLGRLQQRVQHYRRAIELSPKDASLRINCSEALLETGQPESAMQEARAALALSPADSHGTAALARALQAAGQGDEAIRLLNEALKTSDDRDLRMCLADTYLRQGRCREGFEAYEARRRPGRHASFAYVKDPGLSRPEWRGDALAGRRLLVVSEQGLGDNLFAMRYATVLAARGDHVSVVIAEPMRRLLAGQSYLRKVYVLGAPIPRADYDCWCFALSLPARLGEDGTAQPWNRDPYLAAVDDGTMRVDAPPGTLKVGLSWAGSTINPNDALRSIDPQRFVPLAEVPGVKLYSCQHGIADTALPEFLRPSPRPLSDLADTSAFLTQLDLLISIDSAPAHLAAAMGRETWMLARWFGDWRWGESGSESHWYPAIRILRQPRAGDWDGVLEEAKKMLVALCRRPAHR